MNVKEHYELFRYLMKEYCLLDEDIVVVENVAEWCRGQGIQEPDPEKPLKVVSRDGSACRLLLREEVPERVIDERINALAVRGALLNVAKDKAALLDTYNKKLAYLFLSEYAATLPENKNDELIMDEWAFKEMERMGFFRDRGF